jgi:hypothetical protein
MTPTNISAWLPPMLTCGHTAALVFEFGSIRRGQADRRTLTPHHQCCMLSAPVMIVTPAQVESRGCEQGLCAFDPLGQNAVGSIWL